MFSNFLSISGNCFVILVNFEYTNGKLPFKYTFFTVFNLLYTRNLSPRGAAWRRHNAKRSSSQKEKFSVLPKFKINRLHRTPCPPQEARQQITICTGPALQPIQEPPFRTSISRPRKTCIDDQTWSLLQWVAPLWRRLVKTRSSLKDALLRTCFSPCLGHRRTTRLRSPWPVAMPPLDLWRCCSPFYLASRSRMDQWHLTVKPQRLDGTVTLPNSLRQPPWSHQSKTVKIEPSERHNTGIRCGGAAQRGTGNASHIVRCHLDRAALLERSAFVLFLYLSGAFDSIVRLGLRQDYREHEQRLTSGMSVGQHAVQLCLRRSHVRG